MPPKGGRKAGANKKSTGKSLEDLEKQVACIQANMNAGSSSTPADSASDAQIAGSSNPRKRKKKKQSPNSSQNSGSSNKSSSKKSPPAKSPVKKKLRHASTTALASDRRVQTLIDQRPRAYSTGSKWLSNAQDTAGSGTSQSSSRNDLAGLQTLTDSDYTTVNDDSRSAEEIQESIDDNFKKLLPLVEFTGFNQRAKEILRQIVKEGKNPNGAFFKEVCDKIKNELRICNNINYNTGEAFKKNSNKMVDTKGIFRVFKFFSKIEGAKDYNKEIVSSACQLDNKCFVELVVKESGKKKKWFHRNRALKWDEGALSGFDKPYELLDEAIVCKAKKVSHYLACQIYQYVHPLVYMDNNKYLFTEVQINSKNRDWNSALQLKNAFKQDLPDTALAILGGDVFCILNKVSSELPKKLTEAINMLENVVFTLIEQDAWDEDKQKNIKSTIEKILNDQISKRENHGTKGLVSIGQFIRNLFSKKQELDKVMSGTMQLNISDCDVIKDQTIKKLEAQLDNATQLSKCISGLIRKLYTMHSNWFFRLVYQEITTHKDESGKLDYFNKLQAAWVELLKDGPLTTLIKEELTEEERKVSAGLIKFVQRIGIPEEIRSLLTELLDNSEDEGEDEDEEIGADQDHKIGKLNLRAKQLLRGLQKDFDALKSLEKKLYEDWFNDENNKKNLDKTLDGILTELNLCHNLIYDKEGADQQKPIKNLEQKADSQETFLLFKEFSKVVSAEAAKYNKDIVSLACELDDVDFVQFVVKNNRNLGNQDRNKQLKWDGGALSGFDQAYAR